MPEPKLPRVGIIDYTMGNLFSVSRACEFAGLAPLITSSIDDLAVCDAAILPGVGAFGNAMSALRSLGMIKALLDFIGSGKPFMAICLGMQLLMSESSEFGSHKGLNIIQGEVLRFGIPDDNQQRYKIPQVGWNRIKSPGICGRDYWSNSPLSLIRNNEFMYFVHSFYCKLSDQAAALSVSEYAGIEYCSSIKRDNILAFQFHPEKSGLEGLKIFKSWARTIRPREI